MPYFDGTTSSDKYVSSASMGSAKQFLTNGILLDMTGYTIIDSGRIVFWDDYQNEDKIPFLPQLSKGQQLAVNIFRQENNLNSTLFFLALDDAGEMQIIKDKAAQNVMLAYRNSRYYFNGDETENFPLLGDFITDYFGADKLYQWSVPFNYTKPMRASKRGSRGKNRGNKK